MSDHHHYHNNSSGPGFTGGFLLGTILGAGVALLLGTQRGKEITEELKEKGLSLIDNFDELLAELEDGINEQNPPPAISGNSAQETDDKDETQMDVQNPNNFSTVKVEQKLTDNSNQPAPNPHPHIESLQAHGRHLFHGIPKKR